MLVCTDSAARGIDIPGVTHVVQADFAATAVDFLHRVSYLILILTPISTLMRALALPYCFP